MSPNPVAVSDVPGPADVPAGRRPPPPGVVATTPAGRLRRIEAVLRDPALTHSEALAVVGVVLHGNGHGMAWCGQRRLRKRYGLSGGVVVSGLRKSLGRHLDDAGTGPHGAHLYRVLAVPTDTPDDDETGPDSAPPSGTLDTPPSAPVPGMLDDVSARRSGTSSAPVSGSSAPVCPAQRAALWHETNDSNQLRNQRREPHGNSPPLAALAPDNGDGNDGTTADTHADADDLDLPSLAGQARGRPLSEKEASVFQSAIVEARAAGCTEALIRHHVAQAAPGAAVWTGPQAARDAVRSLVESWNGSDFGRPRPGLADVLRDLRFTLGAALPAPGTADAGTILARRAAVARWAKAHATTLQAAGFRGTTGNRAVARAEPCGTGQAEG